MRKDKGWPGPGLAPGHHNGLRGARSLAYTITSGNEFRLRLRLDAPAAAGGMAGGGGGGGRKTGIYRRFINLEIYKYLILR